MNKYTLYFYNKSLENEYFYRVALPHYQKIFSMWCKCLLILSIPAALFTFFTGNLQYFGFSFAATTSTLSLIALRFKKSSFNVVAALYNASFVVLNFIFLTITDRKLGVQGDYQTIMYVFAGSQYTFHSILSMGTNVILTSAVIVVQNVTYSIVFYPGNINLLHGLLLFATCFLIWTKYHIEKQKRKNFLLQENEKEWSLFVRDVLPSSVVMVKYDKTHDVIKTKLVNQVSKNNFQIKDEESMKQFLRNTLIWQEPKDKDLQINEQNTRPSLNKSFPRSQISMETLEKYIYYRFKQMDSAQTKESEKSDKSINCNLKLKGRAESIQIAKNQREFGKKQGMQLDQSQLSPIAAAAQRNLLNYINKNRASIARPTKTDQIKNEDFDFNMHTTETYNVEQFKAKIIKNHKLVEVSVKIVFYNLSYPVCSISVDENLKQKVHNISKISNQKEKIYFDHFKRIFSKFNKVINIKNPKLIHPISLLHFNHLKNLYDLITLKQENHLKINYAKFELNQLLNYIYNIYKNYLDSIGVKFSISVTKEKKSPNSRDIQQQENNKERDEVDNNINQLIQRNKEEEEFQNSCLLGFEHNQSKEFCNITETQQLRPERIDKLQNSFDSNEENIHIYNDQQRICQAVINLIENANDYLNKTEIKEKQICLGVKIIQGNDDHSNLLEIKVSNPIQDSFTRENIDYLKEQLKEERQTSNNNLIWKSATYFQPTQIGLRLNEKILEKVSPFNYLNLDIQENLFEASFLVFQDCSVLQNSQNKMFHNKNFDVIRQSQIGICLEEPINNIQNLMQKETMMKSNMIQSNISNIDKNYSQFDLGQNKFLQIPHKDQSQHNFKPSFQFFTQEERKPKKLSDIHGSALNSYSNLSAIEYQFERTPERSNFIKHFISKNISDLNLINSFQSKHEIIHEKPIKNSE